MIRSKGRKDGTSDSPARCEDRLKARDSEDQGMAESQGPAGRMNRLPSYIIATDANGRALSEGYRVSSGRNYAYGPQHANRATRW